MIETPSVAKHSNPNTSTELSISDALENMGHEQVVVCPNPETGLLKQSLLFTTQHSARL